MKGFRQENAVEPEALAASVKCKSSHINRTESLALAIKVEKEKAMMLDEGRLIASPLALQRVDIGFRRPVSQSSSYGQGWAPTELRPANCPGEIFFHTKLEDRPWIIVDLGKPRLIGEIVVWNREGSRDAVSRAIPLSISVSNDGNNWQEVSVCSRPFRGRRSMKPLIITYPSGLLARFLKFTALRKTFLHFDYIEVIQLIPDVDYGLVTNLRFDDNDDLIAEYVHLDNNGLYANFSSLLSDVIKISRCSIKLTEIDVSRGFMAFKDHKDENVFPKFCGNIRAGLVSACKDLDFDAAEVHQHYKDLPLSRLRAVIEVVFPPSTLVARKIEEMIAVSGIMPQKTIAIIYRGTDKGGEVKLASIGEYITLAQRILVDHPDYDIFVQTDQEQARDQVVAAFQGKCGFFRELPVTRGSTVMHRLEFGAEVHMTREEFAIGMIAATMILARCAYIISHTGNTGAWIAFYRGTGHNLFQFDAKGQLVDPSTAYGDVFA